MWLNARDDDGDDQKGELDASVGGEAKKAMMED